MMRLSLRLGAPNHLGMLPHLKDAEQIIGLGRPGTAVDVHRDGEHGDGRGEGYTVSLGVSEGVKVNSGLS